MYSENSYTETIGPNGIHTKQKTENIINGKGTSTIITNDNGIIHQKTEKINLHQLLLQPAKRRRTERRLMSRFLNPLEKKKWKKRFSLKKKL